MLRWHRRCQKTASKTIFLFLLFFFFFRTWLFAVLVAKISLFSRPSVNTAVKINVTSNLILRLFIDYRGKILLWNILRNLKRCFAQFRSISFRFSLIFPWKFHQKTKRILSKFSTCHFSPLTQPQPQPTQEYQAVDSQGTRAQVRGRRLSQIARLNKRWSGK